MELSEVAFLRNGIVEPEGFSTEEKSFLEKMRHSSSYDLVSRVKTFINTFTSMEGQPDDYSYYFLNFLEEISLLLGDHVLWRDEDDKGLKMAIEALERYLVSRLYSTAFYIPTSTDSGDDEKFYYRIRTLQFLQPDHLDLPNRKYNYIAFEMAAQEMSRLEEDVLKSPREKLACVINAIAIITNLLKHSANYQGTGADDLLPYIIYLVILTSPKRIHSNLRFIRRFRRPSSLTSEESYYLIQVESALMFITNLDYSSLSISLEEFNKGIQDAQDRIKNGLDVPRRFTSDNSWERLLTELSATNHAFSEKALTTPTSSLNIGFDVKNEEDGPQLPTINDSIGFPQSEEQHEEEEEEEDNINIEDADNEKDLMHQQTNNHQNVMFLDCFPPNLLRTKFEDLSVRDLRELHSCFLTIADRMKSFKADS